MTIYELIQQLEDAASELGKDAEVRIAYQQNYPLRGTIARVTIPEDEDPYDDGEIAPGQINDGLMLWLAVGAAPYDENPYGPAWAWTGEYPDDGVSERCPDCGNTERQGHSTSPVCISVVRTSQEG